MANTTENMQQGSSLDTVIVFTERMKELTPFDGLVALGAKVKVPPMHKPWGALLAAVYDLDGNILGQSQR